jgi:O-antigen ligase
MIGEARVAITGPVKSTGKKTVSPGKKAFILIGFCGAQLLDVTTTHIGLSQGRQELNGVAAWIIQHNGELAVYALKLSLVAGLVAFLLMFGRSRAVWNAYLIAAWITTFAVINNVYRLLT